MTVVVDEKSPGCMLSLHVRDLPLYDYREALRPSTRLGPPEEEEYEEEDEDANQIVARLFQQYQGSDELERNPNIRLDVRERESKPADLDKECSICQNRFKANESLVTLSECKHVFHYRCISQWGQYKQDCPLCRVAIPVLER